MTEADGGRRLRKALLGVGYLIVLAGLLLVPSPNTLITLASMVWVAIGLVAWSRSSPSATTKARRERREARQGFGGRRRGSWDMVKDQRPTPGRRGDNPHR